MEITNKGITEVLGAVLLIALTIAAAGIFFLRSHSILQNSSEGLSRDDISDIEITPVSAAEDDGDVILNVRNTGEKEVEISWFNLMIHPEDERSPMIYQTYADAYPERADQKPNFRFEQDDRKFFIDPYNDTETGKEWYPDTNQLGTADSPLVNALSSFAVLLYKDTSTGTEYLVFNNQNSNETMPSGQSGSTEIDIYNIPSGTSVNYSDGGAGEGPGSRDNTPELALGVEPEGDWGWITSSDCCYDGGVLKMREGW